MAVSQRVGVHVSKSMQEALKNTSTKRSCSVAVIIKNAILWYSQNPNALPSLEYAGKLEASLNVRLNEDQLRIVEEQRSARTVSTYLRNALECYMQVLDNPNSSNNNEIRPSPPLYHDRAEDGSTTTNNSNKVKSLYDMNIKGF